ncbi:MAG: HD domain-containing protein [Firmicutes bacterium]|nr:HD domain-containing protein [Bacillota bacterium]
MDSDRTWMIDPAELIAGLSRALDLTEGEPMGHSVRSCWIGMQLAEDLKLEDSTADELYYALLLKDAGCSANAAQVSSWFGTDDHTAKADLKQVNWSRLSEAVRFAVRNAAPGQHFTRRLSQMVQLSGRGISAAQELVHVRCTRGAQIVRSLGWDGDVPDAVLNLDEHWDGSGHPRGLKGEEIPIMSRILLLSQTAEIFWRRQGPDAARQVVAQRRGTWFDPSLADVFLSRSNSRQFFEELAAVDAPDSIQHLFPRLETGMQDLRDVLHTAEIFGQIVDAKSPWTRLHSIRTAHYAAQIAAGLGWSEHDQAAVRITGFFHDLGKLGVSNAILDKPGQLTAEERQRMEVHAALTFRVLEPLEALRPLAYAASCHHERLDGSGYHQRLRGEEVPVFAQVVAVADVFDALTADRPYRAGMSPEEAFALMRPDVGIKLSGPAFEVLTGLAHPLALPEGLEGVGP